MGSVRAVTVPPARAAAIRRRLLAWYHASHRRLPWRQAQEGADPYRVWLAEVMLQQTRVEAVVPYFRRFAERFPSLEALAGSDEQEVLALWSGLGYYARARNLRRAAREALDRHGGLPRSLEALRALPGFGRYTAGALASIAFGIRAAAVDGNAARVLARLFLLRGRPEGRAAENRRWRIAEALVPPQRPGDFNQALMELGATVCTRAPACRRCPLEGLCAARRAGLEGEVPPPHRRAAPRRARLACAAVARDGALLLARRESRGLFGGLWELPSAEVAPGADAGAALARAARERHGIGLRVGQPVAAVERMLTHRALRLEAYACTLQEDGRFPAGLRWARPADLPGMGVAAAFRALAEAVLAAGPPAAPRRRRAVAMGKGP